MNKNKKIIFIIAIMIIIATILIGKVIADNFNNPTVQVLGWDMKAWKDTKYTVGEDNPVSFWTGTMFKSNPSIYCVEHGKFMNNHITYNVGSYYKVQDPILAYILCNLSDESDVDGYGSKTNAKQHLLWYYIQGKGNNISDLNALKGHTSPQKYVTLSGSELTLWNKAEAYANNLAALSVTITDRKIQNDNVIVSWNGNADSYNVYINNSNTAYKSDVDGTSISIPISEFNGDTAKVKVEGKKQCYEAGFYPLTGDENQRSICIAYKNTTTKTSDPAEISIPLNTDVSLQKYITKVNGNNLTSNETSLTKRINKKTSTSETNTDVKDKISTSNTATNEYKRNNVVKIEVGDTVTYRIHVYNNSTVTAKEVLVKDAMPYVDGTDTDCTSLVDIVSINDESGKGVSYKIDKDNGKWGNNGKNINTYYWYVYNMAGGASTYFDVTLKFKTYTTSVLTNTAWISSTKPNNKKTYRTCDRDYIQMKPYKVSLEKFVTKVTDANGQKVENYNQTSGTYQDRSGKRYNTEAKTNLDTNKNTYKYDNKVQVEPGDIVTYTIKLKNEGDTKVSIGQIYDSFTYYKDGTIKLTQTGSITGNGGGRYETNTYGTTDNTYDRHLITFNNPTLLDPGKYVDVTIQFKVEIETSLTASSHTLINTAAIITDSLKNKNNITVPDGDGTDNNRDSDYIITKTYAVSLEKYISKVNGKQPISKNYDFNGDGVVDNADVYLLQGSIVGLPVSVKEKIEKYGDIDNDGIIEIDDAAALQRLINKSKREGHAEHRYDDDTSTNNEWKYNNPVTVSNGDTVTYTIKVTNNSKDASVYITEIADYLPDGVIYNGTKYNGNQYNITTDNKVTFTRTGATLLRPGDSTSFTITVTVTEPNISLNILKNTAEITKMKNRNKIEVKDTTPNNNKDSDYIQLNYGGPNGDVAIISGTVWNDKALDKIAENYNGQYDDGKENKLSGIKVMLYRNGTGVISTTTTNSDGYYCFTDSDIDSTVVKNSYERYIKAPKNKDNDRWNDSKTYYSYYIVFEYDGITYTSTPDGKTCVSVTDNAAYKNGTYKTNSNAKEDNGVVKEKRQSFNSRFSKINNQSGISYTTKNEDGCLPQSNHVYKSATMAMQSSTNLIQLANSTTLEEQIKYINLGLRGRDIFDLRLDSDVYSTKVTVNGQDGSYNYNNNKVTVRKSDINVAEDSANFASEAREASISEVEQAIRKTDLDVNEANKRVFGANPYTETGLGIEVTYKIIVTNESKTDGTATKIANYYDSRYTFVKAYVGNTTLSAETGDSGSGFKSVIIETPGTNLSESDAMEIYVVYKLNTPTTTLKDLISGTKTIPTYNMAEVYEYTTKCGRGQTEYTRGLIDKDSAPGSANKEQVRTNTKEAIPTTTVQYYFGKISNSSVDLEKLKYEDDTYATPTLYFTTSKDGRIISGTVFEDSTKYYNDRVKSGNGIKDQDEPEIEKVRVLLLEETTGENTNIKYNNKRYIIRYETYTDKDGKYSFEGFLPGNYIISYEYGNLNTFIYGNGVNSNEKSYNGEDFQSTNNTGKIEGKNNSEIATLNSTSNYWYAFNKVEGVSTGTDDIDRREEVSEKVANYNDYQMTVLNNAKAGKSEDECTVKDNEGNEITATRISTDTWMKSFTPEMNLTVEETVIENGKPKQRNEFNEYNVTNMNFGIAELPVTTIDLQKHVSSFTVTDSAGDNTIAKVTKQTDGNWKVEIGNVLAPEGADTIDVSIEEEKLQGAKLEVTFEITAEMKVEKDFRNGKGIIATINAMTDFIDNDLSYNEALGENIKYWKVGTFAEDATSTIEGANQYVTVVEAIGENELLKLKEDGTAKATITLEKVLSSSDVTIGDIIASSINTYEYDNNIEIMGIDYTNTKTKIGNKELELKDRIRTPVTNDPTTNNMIIIAGKQHDSAKSETIAIHPPTGENNNINYYIIAVISLIVLSTGIVLIKKYAIKKD